MNIDKTRFLFLTGSIAAASGALIAVGASGCSAAPATADGGTPSSANDASATTDDDGGASTTDGGSSSKDAGSDAATACLGDKFPGPSCEDPATKCLLECTKYAGYFKSDVAKAINDCLNLAPTCEGAGAECIKDALPKACVDTTVEAFCAPIVEGCAGQPGNVVTKAACEGVAKALSADGRTALTTCYAEGACSIAPIDCVQ